MIAEAQRRGGICAFIDAEHAMDPQYARKVGVNIDELLVSQPDHGEQALEIAELLIRSGALDVVAVDSVAALTPKAEIEGEMGDSHVGLQARLMSQALRKLAGTLNRTDTICLFTNQLREKIGVMFGSPETTPGGRALKFYASVRLDIRRIETLKEGVEAIGNRVRVKVVKNKVAPPFKQAEFDIIYGSGISWEGTVLEAGLERKVVQKSGSYFSFDEERLGQGRQNAAAFLREHPDVSEKIVQRIQAELGEGAIASARLLPAAPVENGGAARRRRPRLRSKRFPPRVSSLRARRGPGRGRARRRGVAHAARRGCPALRTGYRCRARPRACACVGRELRRHEAMARATNVLRRRDVSAKELDTRLERAHIDPTTRAEVVTRLDEVGAVDDGRFACRRAEMLAERGAGDESSATTCPAGESRSSPSRRPFRSSSPSRARAARVVGRRGSSPKTARYLAGKGFSEDAIESALEEVVAEDAPPAVF